MSMSLADVVATIRHGGPRLTAAIFFVALVLGIVVLHYVFRGLVHILSRYTKIPVYILRHVVRFMPFMTGICAGIYAADSFMELPDFVENHIGMIFYNVVAVTVILFLAHLISAFLQYKMTQSQARNSSTSILTTIINIFVYASGLVILLNAHGISISPLLTAMGVGGIASALALQDTLANLFSGIMTLVSKQIRIGDYIKLSTARHILANSQYGVTGFEPAVRYKELGEYGISFDVVLRIRNVIDEAVLKHQFIKAIYQAYQDNGIHLLERTA